MGKGTWTLFAIKPSTYISSLCYSIFRLEPYSSCSYGCIYCYARWYRSGRSPVSPGTLLVLWRSIARRLSKIDLPPVFFRLSTLTEPFQENMEASRVLSLEMLRTALKYEIPVVVNTKSTLLTRSPWLDVILSMADKKLVLIQYSLVAFREDYRIMLEPRSPPTRQRLEAIEFLREHAVPVVVRVQPLIPGLEEDQLGVVREALSHGSLGVIVESIRETREGLEKIARSIGLDPGEYFRKYRWEPYQFTEVGSMKPLLHPGIEWRRRVFKEIKCIVESFGRTLTLCKEGVWREFKKPCIDCCQFFHVRNYYALRETLHEHVLGKHGSPSYVKVLESTDYTRYPRILGRALKLHHNKLLKTISDQGKLSRLIIQHQQ